MAILGQAVETAAKHLLPELFEGTTEVGKQLWKTVPAQDKATAKWLAKHDLPRHKQYTTAVDNGDTLTMSAIADQGDLDSRAWREQQQVGKLGQEEVDIKPALQTELDELIARNQANLETAPSAEVPGVMQPETTKLYPGTIEQLTPDLERYIELNEALGSKQPRRGWEEVFGNVVGEDGYTTRVSGGMKRSKHGLSFVSLKDAVLRARGEEAYFRAERARPGTGWHKHHVAHIKSTEPFALRPDGSLRSIADREEIVELLADEGITFGNRDLNEMYLGEEAHLGIGKAEQKGSTAVHATLADVTDIQGFSDWRTQAKKIYYELPAGKGQKNKRYKWYNNDNGVLTTARGGNVKLPKGAKALQFRIDGALGTYNVGQKHGFSDELLRLIAAVDDPADIVELIKIFVNDSGAMQAMQGAAALAHQTIDAGKVSDDITEQLSRQYAPQMYEFIDVLRRNPDYQNNVQLMEIVNEVEAIARELSK